MIHRLTRILTLALPLLVLAAGCSVQAQEEDGAPSPSQEAERPMVLLETSKGPIRIELEPEKAPKTVENFLAYVDAGFYDGTIFHRVIPGFMIQGGGVTPDMQPKQTRGPIVNEADNGLRNLRGTLAMARTQQKDSATAQFFVNLSDNAFLDHGARDFGYAVFGRVTEGMEVVDAIAEVETESHGMHQNVPVEPVVIESARRVEAKAAE